MKIKGWLDPASSNLELLVDHSVLFGEPVDAIVGFPHPPDGSTDGIGLKSSSHATWSKLQVLKLALIIVIIETCGLVNLGNVDLHTGVVLGRQDPVAGRAFPGNRRMQGYIIDDRIWHFV